MKKFLLLFQVSIICTLLSVPFHEKGEKTITNTLPEHHTGSDLLFPDFDMASAINAATDPQNSMRNTYPEHALLRQTLMLRRPGQNSSGTLNPIQIIPLLIF